MLGFTTKMHQPRLSPWRWCSWRCDPRSREEGVPWSSTFQEDKATTPTARLAGWVQKRCQKGGCGNWGLGWPRTALLRTEKRPRIHVQGSSRLLVVILSLGEQICAPKIHKLWDSTPENYLHFELHTYFLCVVKYCQSRKQFNLKRTIDNLLQPWHGQNMKDLCKY